MAIPLLAALLAKIGTAAGLASKAVGSTAGHIATGANNLATNLTGNTGAIQATGNVSPQLLSVQPSNFQAPVYPNNMVTSSPVGTTGVMQNIADFAKDLTLGFNENSQNAFDPTNLTSNTFTEKIQPNNTKLADYQRVLKDQRDTNGKRLYSDEVVDALAEGKNSGRSELAEWVKNNPDAYPTTKTYDKGIAGRIGEGIGTAYRFANSPIGQAILGGGVGMLTSGNPGIALNNGLVAGMNRAKSNVYNQALEKFGIQPGNGLLYNSSANDLSALSGAYGKSMNDAYHQAMIEHYKRQDEIDSEANQIKAKYNNEKIAVDNKKADKTGNSRTKSTSKAKNSSSNKPKLQDSTAYKQDYSRFVAVMNGNYSDNSKAKAKSYMAQKYGVIPKF